MKCQSISLKNETVKVGEIGYTVDEEYLKVKSLLVKYNVTMNCRAMVIFDD
jgi:hypothetical protein